MSNLVCVVSRAWVVHASGITQSFRADSSTHFQMQRVESGGWWCGARPHLKILEIVTEISSGLVDRKISSVDLELELETEREGGLS